MPARRSRSRSTSPAQRRWAARCRGRRGFYCNVLCAVRRMLAAVWPSYPWLLLLAAAMAWGMRRRLWRLRAVQNIKCFLQVLASGL